MISNNDQTLVCVLLVPFPQRGNYVLAVYSAVGPHLEQHDFPAQVCQEKGFISIQPGAIVKFGRLAIVG